MKKYIMKIMLMAIMSITLSIAANAQQTNKIIAVINRADWCPVCQQNGEKVMKEVMPVFNQSSVQFVMNDLTDDASKEKSKMALKEMKVYDAVKKTTSTGLILLVDEASGKLISKISVAEPLEKLVQAIKESAMAEKMMNKM
ncbi:MAG: hypothetical protein SGI96_00990 [Bacteroidota bacterium]|nr:hypothetical protein [Bacteroidota bacterium]